MYYLLQDDVLITSSMLFRYYRAQRASRALEWLGWFLPGPTLKEARTPRAEDSTWHTLTISFTVDPEGFSIEEFRLVEITFNDAVKDWEGICGASFRYVPFGSQAGFSPDFSVVRGTAEEQAASRFVATAFLGPNGDDRKVRVFGTFFTSQLNQRGAFRHEVGHVLGFVHEHNDLFAPSDCPKDDPLPPSHNLTSYDRRSLMHYVCGIDGGTTEFDFTGDDIRGARAKYPLR